MSANQKLINTKSLLAKLLAAEGITVVHQDVPTAMFDTVNRILYCPIWKDMTNEIYDLLIGHEVGHALFTPREGLHTDTSNPDHNKLRNLINITEDARIEKKIKRRFPGLRTSFSVAYKNLFDRDLFGIKKLNGKHEQLNLADRVNLYFKVGAHMDIKFTNEIETDIVRRLEAAETFPEVVKLAEEILAYMKEHEQDKINSTQQLQDALQGKFNKEENQQQQSKQSDDLTKPPGAGGQDQQEAGKKQDKKEDQKSGSNEKKEQEKAAAKKKQEAKKAAGEESGDDASEEDGDESGAGGDEEGDEEGNGGEGGDTDANADGKDEAEGKDGEGSGKGECEEGDDEAKGGKPGKKPSDKEGDKKSPVVDGHKGGMNDGQRKNPPEDPISVTDKIFRQREEELVDKNNMAVNSSFFPSTDVKKMIMDVPNMLGQFEHHTKTECARTFGSEAAYADFSSKLLQYFTKKHKNAVQMLVKEFDMKKNAIQYYRAKHNRSGDLDSKLLPHYKFKDDLFRRVTEMPKGKNHGIIIFVDMSSSMDGHYMYGVVDQMLMLLQFCGKMRIPFDVYGFADTGGAAGQGFLVKNPLDVKFRSHNFVLRHLISSRLKKNLMKRAFGMLAYMGYLAYKQAGGEVKPIQEMDSLYNNMIINAKVNNSALHQRGLTSPICIRTGGTPFCETIVASRQIIDEFKATTRVDITNVIYMTDGAGSHSADFGGVGGGRGHVQKSVLTDPRTKHMRMIEVNNQQAELTAFVKTLTGCRHIGYYICNNQELEHRVGLDENDGNYMKKKMDGKIAERVSKVLKDGYLAVPTLGYDNYYFISSDLVNRKKYNNLDEYIADNKRVANAPNVDVSKALGNFLNANKKVGVVLRNFAAELAVECVRED